MFFTRLLFSQACSLCHAADGDPLCANCLSALEPVRPPLCPACGLNLPPTAHPAAACADCLSFKPSFIQMRSAVIYNAKGAALLKAFKCADHWRLGDWLIQRMEEVAHTLPLADLEAIIPMPLALGKHWTRSYSTAHWLAKGLARRLGLRYHALGLLRIPSLRPHQHRLQRADRLALDAALFWAHRASVKGRYLLLVDDVATTGATARAASTALLKAGARGVYVLTAARTPRWVAGPTVPAPSCSARIP